MPIEMKCENCEQPFYCYPSEAEKGRKYCNLECRSKHRFQRDLPAASRTPVGFTCRECQKPFAMMQSYLTAYRKKFDHDPFYCSMDCTSKGRRRETELRNNFECVNCGKPGLRGRNKSGRVYVQQKLCSRQCKNEWVSKLRRDRDGLPEFSRRKQRKYMLLRVPARDGNPTHEILEHRYVMEQSLGRKLLPAETVHHKNGDTFDNRLENLELFGRNHGRGQRVTDLVSHALEVLRTYEETARKMGYELEHISDAPSVHASPTKPPS